MINKVNKQIEEIVAAYKGNLYFINFELEEIKSKQKFPIMGSLSSTAGHRDNFKFVLTNLVVFMSNKMTKREVEDTDVAYNNIKRSAIEDMKETLREVMLLMEDKFLHTTEDDIIFDVEEQDGLAVVTAEAILIDFANKTRTITRFDFT